MMIRMERPTATIALLAPRRRAMRRERSPRKVSVCPAATAASPSTRASYGLPCPVVAVPLGLPADSLTPGANLAHETRCPAVGNRARVDADLGDEQVHAATVAGQVLRDGHDPVQDWLAGGRTKRRGVVPVAARRWSVVVLRHVAGVMR